MSRVKSRNTTPELTVRRIAHRLGYRFRLHRRDLPGKPDIVFPRLKTAIFVHGCFWHRHRGCAKAGLPKSRVVFWKAKFDRNVVRDKANRLALRRKGWRVLTVWQCETRDDAKLSQRLQSFLSEGDS